MIINLRMSQVSVEIETFVNSQKRHEEDVSDHSLSEITGASFNTDRMDTIDLLTYLVAALGVLVLGLCVVVASLLIYQHFRYQLNIDPLYFENRSSSGPDLLYLKVHSGRSLTIVGERLWFPFMQTATKHRSEDHSVHLLCH